VEDIFPRRNAGASLKRRHHPRREQQTGRPGKENPKTSGFSPFFSFQPPPPHQSIPQPRCTAAYLKPFQINALNLVGKIGLPSSFGENSRIWRENAGTFRLRTIKLARRSFVFKGL
jgi:hypothetical protein